ncbi:alcohol dehydrogenase catalytic domain-containing protein [Aureimonas altamirensis]|uniref:alcohol dehydrogenase catalytic domain-containing protein n=1 Tax=Aureimonas altamirensis TaxID=370622 RepID=UPI003D8174EE
MFRVVAHEFGSPEDSLIYEPAVRPVPRRGNVLVRMRASAINPSDLIPVTGAYRHRTTLPFVPGYDGFGIVAEIGPGVDASWIGRRVLPLGSAGNWSTWKMLPADWCVGDRRRGGRRRAASSSAVQMSCLARHSLQAERARRPRGFFSSRAGRRERSLPGGQRPYGARGAQRVERGPRGRVGPMLSRLWLMVSQRPRWLTDR